MRVLMTDKRLDIDFAEGGDNHLIDLSKLKIANCVGCFGCWVKTPGRCVIRDDAPGVYSLVARCDELLCVTGVAFGSYDTTMKTMLERTLPTQQAFIRIYRGETHHLQRDVTMKKATVVAYGASGEEEREVFSELVRRNACNMSFDTVRVLFADEEKLEEIVKGEAASWRG